MKGNARWFAAIAVAALLPACAATSSTPAPPAPPAAAKAAEAPPPPVAAPERAEAPTPPPGETTNMVESIPLQVVMTDQTTTGRVMKVRGKLVNPHAQAVDGARLQLVFLAPTGGEGTSPRVLEIQQKEVNSNIPPGGSAAFRWDVESVYLGSGSGQFMIVAYPMKLGGQEMPPPDHWNE